MGELVQELERLGYVERRPDPGDARAKLVILTDRGRGAREVGLRAMDAIEARWTRALGGHDVPPLRTVLTTLLELPD